MGDMGNNRQPVEDVFLSVPLDGEAAKNDAPGLRNMSEALYSLHQGTVLSRRAFFQALKQMMVVAGVATLGGSAISKALGIAEAATANNQAASLPATDQWVMAIDLALCDGCRQCQRACKTGHFLPPDDHNWIEVWKETGDSGDFYRPRPCMHCEAAPCVEFCPVGATYHNENGIVLVDAERCIGCRLCMIACPYDARSFWWDEPNNPPHLSAADYTPETAMPHVKGTVTKCVFCADYLNASRLPRCVQQCPKDVLWFGEKTTDLITNGVVVRKLSELLQQRGAYRYKEDLGTKPRVYYLPPGEGA